MIKFRILNGYQISPAIVGGILKHNINFYDCISEPFTEELFCVIWNDVFDIYIDNKDVSIEVVVGDSGKFVMFVDHNHTAVIEFYNTHILTYEYNSMDRTSKIIKYEEYSIDNLKYIINKIIYRKKA